MKISILLFLILMSLLSCSRFARKTYDFSNVGEMTIEDYVAHLSSLGGAYVFFSKENIIPISKESDKYLKEIYQRIIQNNEIFLPNRVEPQFYLIKNSNPFVFSLPGSQFFISSTLITKFLKNEQVFVAAVTREIIRSQRNLYEKQQVLPTGNISTDKMMSLMRLQFEAKNYVNEWAYVVLKRAGYDSSALLAWIQLQNKNPLEFSFYGGERSGLIKEEYTLKNFLVKEKMAQTQINSATDEKNSSKQFYKLLSEIRI